MEQIIGQKKYLIFHGSPCYHILRNIENRSIDDRPESLCGQIAWSSTETKMTNTKPDYLRFCYRCINTILPENNEKLPEISTHMSL